MKRVLILVCRLLSALLIFLSISFLFQPKGFFIIKDEMARFAVGIETPLFVGIVLKFVSLVLTSRVKEEERSSVLLAHTWGTLLISLLVIALGTFSLIRYRDTSIVLSVFICILSEMIYGFINIKTTRFGKLFNNNVVGLSCVVFIFAFSILIPLFASMNNYAFDEYTIKPIGLCFLLIAIFMTYAYSPSKVLLFVLVALFTAGGVTLFIFSRADYAIPLITNALISLVQIFKKNSSEIPLID